MIRFVLGPSIDTGFSINVCTPLWIAAAKCTARNAGGVAKIAISPGRKQSIACWYAYIPVKARSSGTSTRSLNCSVSDLRTMSTRLRNTSAIATILSGVLATESASAAAPPPRPPQPINATRISLLPPACTAGAALSGEAFSTLSSARLSERSVPANTAAAACVVVPRNRRRELPAGTFSTDPGNCFFGKITVASP